jgi:hypothetical protein
MGKRSFQNPSWTATATADAATTLATNTHMTLGALATTSGLLVQEIEIGGQSGSSTVNIMMFARHQIVGVTPTILAAPQSDGPMHTLGQAAATGNFAACAFTTPPQRSTATQSARLNLTFNGFGGIVRWQAAPFEEWGIVGTAVNISESSLSAFTGGASGVVGSHIIYEAYNS